MLQYLCIAEQQQLQGQFITKPTQQNTSSYLTPLSNKQHSFLWIFSLIQDAKALRWNEGEWERCLENLDTLNATVFTSLNSTSVSPILEATTGAMMPRSASWELIAWLERGSSAVSAEAAGLHSALHQWCQSWAEVWLKPPLTGQKVARHQIWINR